MPSRILLRALLPLALTTTAGAQPPRRAEVVARIDSLANAMLADTVMPTAGLSIAVVHGRDTLVMKGYGLASREANVPMTARTVHGIASITKQFTSALIMQLVEEGRLSLDDTLGALLPQGSAPAHWHGVTLRRLLNHTSGLPSYTDFPSHRRRVESWGRVDRDSLLAALRADSLVMFAPGAGFYYNNTGYWLLGFIVERVTGKPYGQYLRERLSTRLGLRSTAFCPGTYEEGQAVGYAVDSTRRLVVAPRGNASLAFSSGGLCSTVGDVVTWTHALASGRVVSRASYEAMTTPAALRSPRRMNYGFALISETIGTHRVIHHGGASAGFAARVSHLPDDSLTVVVLANTGGVNEKRLADNIVRAVFGLPVVAGPPPVVDLPTTAVERAALVGRYAVAQPDGRRREATVEDVGGQLMLRLGTDTPRRLRRQQGDVYVTAGPPPTQRILFDVHNGKATGFILDHSLRPLPASRVE